MRELLSSAETKSATKVSLKPTRCTVIQRMVKILPDMFVITSYSNQELNAYQIKMQELEAHIQKSDVRCKELALKVRLLTIH